MHLGSTVTGPEPSLYLGGYDQTRVLGSVLVSPGGMGPVNLMDISTNVVSGHSPFSFPSSQAGPLAMNSAIGDKLTVGIGGCAPYISLPKSTCDNIARFLPVEYDSNPGLKFCFGAFFHLPVEQHPRDHRSVPFKHLNLTLDEPLASPPIPYVPCNPQDDFFVLGRAFLQDAFIGQNYEDTSLGGKEGGVFYVAQAPGPNISTSPNVVELGGGGLGVSASTSDQASTWVGHWTPLTADQAYNYTTLNSNTSSDGFNPGTIAGITIA
ncbi:hypothetical protein F5Y13DRAFT_188034 [Hypoxylon sp. FL1857]|nr:hypothetical protein F5Y13DRAFT_188034 [Hypoxylon sp. FL1857]